MYFPLLPCFNFLSGHRFLHKAFGTTRKNQRVINFFLKDYVRYSVNITVYRLQTDCFVSFFSDVTLTFKSTLEQLTRDMFSFR